MIESEGRRWSLIGLLLAVGIVGWVWLFGRNWEVFLTVGPWGPGALAVIGLIALAAAWLLPVRFKIPFPSKFWTSILAGVLSALYLWTTARAQGRTFAPYLHDEFSYLIQTHQLAHGRLWMAAHPLAAFFDSFQLVVRPVYASIYFPGTALLHVPGIWLGLAPWITSLAIAGLVVILLHRIVNDLVDPPAAWLAVLLLLCCPMFRTLSLMTMAQLPLLMMGLLATFAWLKWRSKGQLRWATVVGIALGFAAITRPVDAICFAIPIGVAILLSGRRRWPAIGMIVLAIAPFLALQLIANRGISGHWFQTPFRMYADADYPGTAYGFHRYDPSARPQSPLPQKQQLYQDKTIPLIQSHQPKFLYDILRKRLRLTLSLAASTPFPLLMILLPVAAMGLDGKRWVILATLPLFVGLYAFYVFFFPHYVIVASPAIILGILIGATELGRGHPRARIALNLFIGAVAIANLPQFDRAMRDEMFDAPLIREADSKLSRLPGPSVVLFRYSDSRNVDEEPVYNADVAWPDDARVIRAHDLGSQDSAIFRYYADHQPNRRFYRFDETDNSLQYLGTAKELASLSR